MSDFWCRAEVFVLTSRGKKVSVSIHYNWLKVLKETDKSVLLERPYGEGTVRVMKGSFMGYARPTKEEALDHLHHRWKKRRQHLINQTLKCDAVLAAFASDNGPEVEEEVTLE